jgi:UDP-2,4-diacetamido-2,4,6-trideoxy-beta-L-altropyranose hydrolase
MRLDGGVLIRADANAQMGTGHLMRCLALAQAWQSQGGEAIFVTVCDSEGLLQRIRGEGFQVVELQKTYPDPDEWDATSRVLAAYPEAWVVLDGYHFDPAYQRRVKKTGHSLLVIDDMAHLDHYYADVVLNQNIHAAQLDYSCEPYTRLLLGTEYVLLRREFWSWREWEREIPDVARKVLVTLGGGDPDNQTLKVIRALQEVDVEGLEAVVVVGGSNPHWEELNSAARVVPGVRLVRNVSNMPELMAWADVAITAGGSTCWETAFMGLPNLVLILVENQREVAEALDNYGLGLSLGWHKKIRVSSLAKTLKQVMYDSARRAKMSEKGKYLVDGAGIERIIALLDVQDVEGHLQVRRARWRDMELLWQWANDPSVRERSFHSQPIPLDEHVKWYKDKLVSSDTLLLIIERNRVPVAQIRYDRTNEYEAEVSFLVARKYRGEGIGTKTLKLTSDLAYEELGIEFVRGVVFSSNEASQRVFIKAGFKDVGQEQISGRTCRVFVKECLKDTGELS